MKSVKSHNQIFWVMQYWFKALEYQIWWTNTKLFFWESIVNLETLEKPFSYIWPSFKFILKSAKCLNGIFWVIQCWFEALECQNWLTNTILIFWEAVANLITLQKLSPYIGVSYKFVLKSVKSLNRILWVIQYWFKSWECQICWTNAKLFFWEREKNLGTLQKLSPYIGVSFKFVLKTVKILN